jgi:hypothetical protein
MCSDRLAACVLTLLAGCAGQTHPAHSPVTGSVTLDGKPLGSGAVLFESATGFAGSANLASGGTFRMRCQYGDGLPVGHYRVAVVPTEPDPLRRDAAPASPIPLRYRDFATSGLQATMEKGCAPFDFDLRSGLEAGS